MDEQNVIEAARLLLESMTDDERLEFMDAITEGYCMVCGGPAPCNCWNDE